MTDLEIQKKISALERSVELLTEAGYESDYTPLRDVLIELGKQKLYVNMSHRTRNYFIARDYEAF